MQHADPKSDQQQRPEPQDLMHLDHAKRIQKEYRSNDDQGNGATARSPVTRINETGELIHSLPLLSAPGRVVRLERHVKNEDANKDPEQRLESVSRVRTDNADQQPENDRVHQPLGVLPVVDSADARDKAQNESKPRISVARRRSGLIRRAGGKAGCRRVLGAVDCALGHAPAVRAERLTASAAECYRGHVRVCGTIHVNSPFDRSITVAAPFEPYRASAAPQREERRQARAAPPPAGAPPHSGPPLPAAPSNPASAIESRKQT